MSDQWVYVVAAYALTALLTGAVLAQSWAAMHSAERRADALRKDRT